ncbi:MAG: hypothetical protein IJW43_04775 [Clostridia bacterium]|nr:hypothetical protein [Clostridia bacterium]
MYFRLILGVILIVSSIMISKELSKKYCNKRIFFNDFYSFNQLLINEVSFSNNTLPSIIEKIELKTDFYKIINEMFVIGSSNIFLPLYLSEKEKEFSIFYLKNVGKGDSISQKNYFLESRNQILEYLEESKLNEKKYTPLYLKIGVLLGILIFIIII